jgi:hypothetical protein
MVLQYIRCTLLSQIIIIGLPWLKEELSNLLNSLKTLFGNPMIFSGVLLCTVEAKELDKAILALDNV